MLTPPHHLPPSLIATTHRTQLRSLTCKLYLRLLLLPRNRLHQVLSLLILSSINLPHRWSTQLRILCLKWNLSHSITLKIQSMLWGYLKVLIHLSMQQTILVTTIVQSSLSSINVTIIGGVSHINNNTTKSPQPYLMNSITAIKVTTLLYLTLMYHRFIIRLT